ncbi:MAG: putative 2OG-Fe(II) oxygenase [Pirellulales bacterium]|nr:putative 2OG-Fe(II) oxygenase [Pirellulales bacterium]
MPSPPQPTVEVQKLWATTFYAFQRPDHTETAGELIKDLYELRDGQNKQIDSHVAPAAKSTAGLYESDFDLLSRPVASLQKLHEFLTRCLQLAVSHINGGKVPPEKIQPRIVDSWYHITNDGGFHDAHFHGGCSWCGIYYIQLGQSGPVAGGGAPNGGSRFYSPLGAGGNYRDYGNQYLNQSYMDPPLRNGMVLLFPAYLLHSGLPYRGETDRVLIAFNAQAEVKK